MARTLYGGSPADVIAQPTPSTTDDPTALGIAQSVTVTVWTAETGGTQLTDLQNAAQVGVSAVTTDSLGRLKFYGPDAYTAAVWVETATGVRWRINPADLAARNTADWTTITSKPAGIDTPVTQAQIVAGTDTTARLAAASVLYAATRQLVSAQANLYVMAVWDGTGTQPARPTLPAGTYVRWRQPTAPTGAVTGDEWLTT